MQHTLPVKNTSIAGTALFNNRLKEQRIVFEAHSFEAIQPQKERRRFIQKALPALLHISQEMALLPFLKQFLQNKTLFQRFLSTCPTWEEDVRGQTTTLLRLLQIFKTDSQKKEEDAALAEKALLKLYAAEDELLLFILEHLKQFLACAFCKRLTNQTPVKRALMAAMFFHQKSYKTLWKLWQNDHPSIDTVSFKSLVTQTQKLQNPKINVSKTAERLLYTSMLLSLQKKQRQAKCA